MSDRIIGDLNDTRIKRRGLSLSGGDPLHPANVPQVLALVKRVRAECPGKDIWCWTGYLLGELSPAQRELVCLLDVLVDGKFEKGLADPGLLWRGSSNQIIHDLNAWREQEYKSRIPCQLLA
ncbi:anaerobic ribonucleotide reductase-activating protein [compost metagenome]